MPNGSKCPAEGQPAVDSAAQSLKNAKSAHSDAQKTLHAKNSASVDWGKSAFNSVTKGDCNVFYNSMAYTTAENAVNTAKTTLEEAKGAVSEATRALAAAKEAQATAIAECQCKTWQTHQKAVKDINSNSVETNTATWTKAEHLRCVIAGKKASTCTVPPLPQVKAAPLASGVNAAACEGGLGKGGPVTFNNLCISARDDEPSGPFTLDRDVTVDTMVFTHKSGQVSCRGSASGRSNWGCDNDLVGVVVADSGKNQILPTNNQAGISKTGHGHAFWYKADGVTKNTPSMTWTLNGKTIKKGTYRLWYNEDLTGGTEGDNSGKACYDLTIKPQ